MATRKKEPLPPLADRTNHRLVKGAGARLKQARKDARVTMKMLERALKVPAKDLKALEAGKNMPLGLYLLVAERLRIEPAEILGNKWSDLGPWEHHLISAYRTADPKWRRAMIIWARTMPRETVKEELGRG